VKGFGGNNTSDGLEHYQNTHPGSILSRLSSAKQPGQYCEVFVRNQRKRWPSVYQPILMRWIKHQ